MQKISFFRFYILLIMAAFSITALGQQEMTVRGRVTDTQGEPLPGVNIVVKGTTTGTITDVDGNYELNVPDPSNAVLVFKFVGFADSEIPIKGQSRIDVVMKEDVRSCKAGQRSDKFRPF